jgi:hypothetical protein
MQLPGPCFPKFLTLYHTTNPEAADFILEHGFGDDLTTSKPGIWLSDLPAITFVGLESWMGHHEDRWIAIDVKEGDLPQDPGLIDSAWPFGQCFVRAGWINQFPMREISFEEVCRIRAARQLFFYRKLLDAIDTVFAPDSALLTDDHYIAWFIQEFGEDLFHQRRLQASLDAYEYRYWLERVADSLADSNLHPQDKAEQLELVHRRLEALQAYFPEPGSFHQTISQFPIGRHLGFKC